jgi:hypothetical protein
MGNRSTALSTYYVRDRMAPTITFTAPADGAVYTAGQLPPSVAYSCDDGRGGSGVALCDGDTPVGAALDDAIGLHEFTVRTSDNDGNTATATARYTVVYPWSGFQPAASGWRVALAGQRVDLGFSLSGYRRPYPLLELPTGGAYPVSEDVPCAPVPPPTPPPGAQIQTRGSLVYDAPTDTYTYAWKTDRLWTGTCRLFIVRLNDGTEHTTGIQFS